MYQFLLLIDVVRGANCRISFIMFIGYLDAKYW